MGVSQEKGMDVVRTFRLLCYRAIQSFVVGNLGLPTLSH